MHNSCEGGTLPKPEQAGRELQRGKGLKGVSLVILPAVKESRCCAIDSHHIKRRAGAVALGYPVSHSQSAGGEADLPNGDHTQPEIDECLDQAFSIHLQAKTVAGVQTAVTRAMVSKGGIAFSLICSHRRGRGAPPTSLS